MNEALESSVAWRRDQPLTPNERTIPMAAPHHLFHGHPSWVLGGLIALLVCGFAGCNSSRDEQPEPTPEASSSETPSPATDNADSEPQAAASAVVELDVDALLDQRLPLKESEQGWIQLFDGQSFFGWQTTDQANWRVEKGVIVVDAGEPSFLATSIDWEDYELHLEYKAAADTNSGIFLRAPLNPQDPETDCYELNIAPPSNPFPTGSLVGRFKVDQEAIGEVAADEWHRYEIRVEGDRVHVLHDGKEVCDYSDPDALPAGRISLQHNEGPIAFRNIRLKPLGLKSLLTDGGEDADRSDDQQRPDDAGSSNSLAQWKRYPDMPGDFQRTDEDALHVTGGRAQLESRQAFGDFVLLTTCRTNAKDLNSGIFFRCIPGEQMNGYECQISNATIDGDPLRPADWGTGGFFKREPARVVAADDEEWFSMLLVAKGPRMAAWVNGIQVSDWHDRRPPDPNPRRGLRTEPGTLMIQAHDPTTDILFGTFAVAPIGPLPEPAWPQAPDAKEETAAAEAEESE